MDLIIQPFANTGNVTDPPQTDPNGFVNWATGYTSDYEISIASGNVQAKAVERAVQNYLFNQMTTMAQLWQQLAIPPWFNNMVGGYQKNAIVTRTNGSGVATPYRSLINSNVTDPLTSPTAWAYIPLPSEMVANIPMPAGGSGGSSAELITTATGFNTLSTGTYQFNTDAIAAASANAPVPSSGSTTAGMLEVKSFGTVTGYSIQRYLDRNGNLFFRCSVGGVWGNWLQMASRAMSRQYGNWIPYTIATVTLSSNIAGGALITFAPTVAATATLPALSTMPSLNDEVQFVNYSAFPVVLSANGTDRIIGLPSGASLASITLNPGDDLRLSVRSATQWSAIAGSAMRQFVPLSVGSATALAHAVTAMQVQNQSVNYALDTGAANACVVNLTPAATAYTDGMKIRAKIAATNTGASTINVNGLGTKAIVGGAHAALAGGELLATGYAEFEYNSTLGSFILLECSGGSLQVANGTKSQHAATLGQVQSGASSYAVDTGTANAYVVNLAPVLSANTDGVKIRFRAANANTAASTLNVNGIGAIALVGSAHVALAGGEIVAGSYCEAEYNSALAKYVLLESTGGYSQLLVNSYLTSTPAQFDNTSRIPSTQFVQRALGNFQTLYGSSGNLALTPTMAGMFITQAVLGTVTLPANATVPLGGTYTVQSRADGVVFNCTGSETMTFGNVSVASVTLNAGDTIEVCSSTGNGWYVVGGSVALKYAGVFKNTLTNAGLQKLPSGLIMQWGFILVNPGAVATVVYPVAFPTGTMSTPLVSPVSTAANVAPVGAGSQNAAGFNIVNSSASLAAVNVAWLALGV